MTQTITPNKQALKEALELSSEILRDVELSQCPLTTCGLKTMRLARLLNDLEMQKIMQYETSGYPTTPTGVPEEVFELAIKANRGYKHKDQTTNAIKDVVYLESIEQLELDTKIAPISLQAAQDPDVSVSSSNPYQIINSPVGNKFERKTIREEMRTAANRLSSRRTLIYEYSIKKHTELKYSAIADDVFSNIRARVDEAIGVTIPDAVNKLSAIYDNLSSNNPEDWSNAAHGCRRILQDLADAIYPSREDKLIEIGGKPKTIKLGKENYINRLITYAEDHSSSSRYQHIVGSHLEFLGDRLESVFQAAQKGTHDTIVDRPEAERCVVYTYLLVGDILSLIK